MSPPLPVSADVSSRRVYLLLCGSLAAQALGQTAMFAVLPSIGREVGLLEIQIGAIIAASSVVFFFAGPIWGRAGDRFGRRRVFLIGQLGYVMGGSLFAASFWFALEGHIAPVFAWFCMIGARMTQATLMSASQPAAGAYVADITGPVSRAKALRELVQQTIWVRLRAPRLAGCSPLCPCWRRLALRWFPWRLRWMIPGIVMYMGAAVVQQTLSFRMQDSLQLNAADAAGAFGAAMMASAIAGLLAQTVIVQRINLSPAIWLCTGLPVIAVALIGMGLFNLFYGFLIANVLMGFGMGFAGAGFNAGASLAVTADEQGAVAGLISACSSAG